ncbi:hypothetical protein MCOR31_008818 [Pyricularia oryzae]|nr:hypothetical protein MCOR31_008818 [Pyricularia oryzae]
MASTANFGSSLGRPEGAWISASYLSLKVAEDIRIQLGSIDVRPDDHAAGTIAAEGKNPSHGISQLICVVGTKHACTAAPGPRLAHHRVSQGFFDHMPCQLFIQS